MAELGRTVCCDRQYSGIPGEKRELASVLLVVEAWSLKETGIPNIWVILLVQSATPQLLLNISSIQ